MYVGLNVDSLTSDDTKTKGGKERTADVRFDQIDERKRARLKRTYTGGRDVLIRQSILDDIGK